MADTFVDGGVDPISRLRVLIADTGPPPFSLANPRLQRLLDDSISEERFLVYLPTGTGGATGATVAVTLETPDPDPDPGPTLLTLTLARTISGEDPDVIQISPGSVPMLRDLINAIGALDKGWRIGLSIGDDIEWFTPSPGSNWLSGLVTVGSLATYAPSINLALAAEAPAYGTQDTALALRWYRFGKAAMAASAALDIGAVASRREGNTARTFRTRGDAIGDQIRRLALDGIYAVA